MPKQRTAVMKINRVFPLNNPEHILFDFNFISRNGIERRHSIPASWKIGTNPDGISTYRVPDSVLEYAFTASALSEDDQAYVRKIVNHAPDAQKDHERSIRVAKQYYPYVLAYIVGTDKALMEE